MHDTNPFEHVPIKVTPLSEQNRTGLDTRNVQNGEELPSHPGRGRSSTRNPTESHSHPDSGTRRQSTSLFASSGPLKGVKSRVVVWLVKRLFSENRTTDSAHLKLHFGHASGSEFIPRICTYKKYLENTLKMYLKRAYFCLLEKAGNNNRVNHKQIGFLKPICVFFEYS